MTPPRQHRIGTIISTVAALATVLALSACAPASHTGGSTHAHAGSGHGGGSVPAPKPTLKPLAAPVSRVTQSCAQLAPASAIATSIGVTVPVVAATDFADAQITFTQAGDLTCNWSDNYAGDRQLSSNHFSLWILPDVSAANWATGSATIAEDGQYKTSIIGGDAYGWCNPGTPGGTVCEVDTRVGTTWISLEVESTSKSFATSDLGLKHFATLINPIVTAAGAASFVKEPKWTNPAATATPATCDAALPDSEIESVAGVTGVGSIGPDLFDQPSIALFWGAENGLGEVECDLASGDQANAFFATIVPSGSWAWSLTMAADSAQPGYTTVPSLGSQAVEYKSPDSDGENIDWVRGGNLIMLSVTLANPAPQVTVAQTLATYLNGQISG